MLVYINLLVESVCFAQSETQIYSDTTLISSVLLRFRSADVLTLISVLLSFDYSVTRLKTQGPNDKIT